MILDYDYRLNNYRNITCRVTESCEALNVLFNDDYAQSLKIIHINIRSLNKNFNEFLVILDALRTQFDVIIFGETWHGDSDTLEQIDGYDMHCTTGHINRNDGVVVYVRRELQATCQQRVLGQTNSLQIDFVARDRRFSVLAIYRSPSTPAADTFIDALYTYYTNIRHNTTHILIGDVNIDILPDSVDVAKDKYLDCLYSSGLTAGIDQPTRVTTNSQTCIDHCFTNHPDEQAVTTAVLTTELTDHYTIACKINYPTNTTDTLTDPTPIFLDMNRLRAELLSQDWGEVVREADVDRACESLIKKVSEAKDKSIKHKKNNTRLKKLKPWITTDIIQKIRQRDKLSKLFKKQPFDPQLRNNIQKIRNEINNDIKCLRKRYFRDSIKESKSNPKKFWGLINEITGLGKTRESFPISSFDDNVNPSQNILKSIANSFNNYFSQVGHNLASNINPQGQPIIDDRDFWVESSMVLRPVTGEELLRCVRDLRGGSAPGLDGITASMVKRNCDILLGPLLHIVNTSILTGIFPNILKTAKVIPIYKTKEKNNFCNYRPISLLSIFAKVIERCVKFQLQMFLEKEYIISETQFGFSRGKNSADTFFIINKDIMDVINRNNKGMLCFIDLAKAFDSIKHDTLFNKLNCIGVRGDTLEWFKSYLGGRKQVVSLCGECSETENIDYGVVQGSTLGPLLFLIYINNLTKINILGKLYLFADDTAILFEGNSWETVYETAASDLVRVKQWFDQNTLSMNISKTKCMPIALRKGSEPPLRLSLKLHSCANRNIIGCNCQEIEQVNHYKYLGVYFDYRLKWDKHISFMTTKLRKLAYAFKLLYSTVDRDLFKIVYHAHAEPIIQYGILAWGGAYKTHINPIITAQKALIKVGLGKPHLYPSDLLFKESNLLSIRKLYIKTLLLYIHSRNSLSLSFEQHTYSTRNVQKLIPVVPKIIKTINVTNSFIIAHFLFRNLPQHLRLPSYSYPAYKRCVVRWLADQQEDVSEALISSIYR